MTVKCQFSGGSGLILAKLTNYENNKKKTNNMLRSLLKHSIKWKQQIVMKIYEKGVKDR